MCESGAGKATVLDCKHILDILASSFAETLWPTRCALCDMPGSLICDACRTTLPLIDLAYACPRCGAPYGVFTCTQCHTPDATDRTGRVLGPPFPFNAARCALEFEEGGGHIVSVYKDAGERRLAEVIAQLMLDALRGAPAQGVPDWSRWADTLVAVPASASAIRRRGFDHMGLVAAQIAKESGLPLLEPLEHLRKALDQRGLSDEQRAANRAGSFGIIEDFETQLGRVILLDDVFTTGASASAATEALLDAGAKEVRFLAFSRVW